MSVSIHCTQWWAELLTERGLSGTELNTDIVIISKTLYFADSFTMVMIAKHLCYVQSRPEKAANRILTLKALGFYERFNGI